jgi:hypothetical protein
MLKSLKMLLSLVVLISILAFIVCATTNGPGYGGKGQTFDILAYPEGIGTLLFFYQPYESVSEKMKFDVALLSESYGGKLRLVLIDVDRKKDLLFRHQIREVPTLILFDRLGTEFHRWLPYDFRIAFSKKEMQRVIDRLLVE